MAVRLFLVPLWALLAAPLGAGPAAPPQGSAPSPSEERLREAWSFLRPEEKRDVADWFRLEVSGLDTFQLQLLRYALSLSPIDPGYWPEAEPAPFFDPRVHAPRPLVRRKRLRPDQRAARAERERLLGDPDPDRLRSAWSYHWATGELRRRADPDDPERIFENGLRGHPPDLDLARALVLRALDDGERRAAHAAFAHAYTDRKGRVFPGITLFDAWNAGKKIEMPDVDTLGIVHEVLGEWTRWTAPVPAREHDALYRRIGELFEEVRHHRGLREALADTFAMGEPPLGGWQPNLGRFHALWEKHASTPSSLAKELPDAAGWKPYLERLIEGLGRDAALSARGRTRRQTLVANERLVRGTLARVMDEYGALARTALPPPPEDKGRKTGGKR